MKKAILFLIVSLIIYSVQAEEHEHPKKHQHNDLGFANTLVYDLNEESLNYGIHLHFIKGLSDTWSLGIGYESIFADEQHHTATLIVKYHFSDAFSINAGPGLTFPSKEHDEYNLSAHFEIVNIYELGPIHLGPIIGLGIGNNEKHISFGLHIGLEL